MNKKWNDTFEKIFESSTQDLTLLESQKTFELNLENHSLENLSYIHSQPDQINIVRIFSQLSSFFELGFLFQKQKNTFAAIQGFAFSQNINLGDLRYGAGVGVSWFSPFGPLKLVFAKALNAKEGETTQTLQFQLGSQF